MLQIFWRDPIFSFDRTIEPWSIRKVDPDSDTAKREIVCVCVCVRERDRVVQRVRERERERERAAIKYEKSH